MLFVLLWNGKWVGCLCNIRSCSRSVSSFLLEIKMRFFKKMYKLFVITPGFLNQPLKGTEGAFDLSELASQFINRIHHCEAISLNAHPSKFFKILCVKLLKGLFFKIFQHYPFNTKCSINRLAGLTDQFWQIGKHHESVHV